jgi:hypothetical protein
MKKKRKSAGTPRPVNVYNRLQRESLLPQYAEALDNLIHFEKDDGYGAEDAEEIWRKKVKKLRPQVLAETSLKFAISGKCKTVDSPHEADVFLKELEKALRKKK